GAVYWWMVKLGNALSLLLSGIVLHFVGFDEHVDVQTADAIVNLRLADIAIPIFTAFLAILVIFPYDITESKANEIREALIARRGKVHHQDEEN
ncbi:MFS transporter, partial [Marinilabilia sp.]